MPFCRNTSVPIPDIEEVLHALFDVVSGGGDQARIISVAEIAEIAVRYASTGRSG
jgi:hypothetical protein